MLFRTALMFDLRSADFGIPHEELYPSALEMIEYADRQGFDNIILAEHHGSPDGYCPVPAVFAAAAGARTRDIMITLCALVLPLHDPVKIAETIAVTDLICGGRLHTVLAAGYADHEFAMFRKSLKDRGRAMDEGLEIITRALAGERFMDGDREVFVRPLPKRMPQLYVGGGVPATARRAAKFGLGFNPLSADLDPLYIEECRKLGREPGPIFGRSVGTHCTEDVKQAWKDIGEYALFMAKAYARISGTDPSQSNSPLFGLDTIEKVRASGMIQMLTPDQCVELAKTRHLSLMPLISGLSPEIGWKSLELFTAKALPRIKELGRVPA
ncbi:LLM class flavin-dependent oxidoreductase [Novosphingobium sp. G106]|uniref:LLM class flavin-dependent oxidoreductase n=1 Tax=Novosphingobium sp. G106 TaxID=2849500 RepID=UPI001C2D8D06|nr:LLM class flavin-dependent oxidoreductase [Novosphingobium sp. G106]MBV1689219.1 LLM class flavin-dependent oxidoreductase [Novosphingobium sp. G106]